MKEKMKKYFYISVGIIAIILGTIGIFLPVLPTVPFLLLALFCFNRSSKKFYNFVTKNKYFGKALKDYHENKSVTNSAKIKAILFLTCGILFSLYKVQHLHMRIFLVIVWIGVTIHLIMLKTKKKENRNKRG